MEDNGKKRLEAYYLALMKKQGKDVDENKLDYIISALNEKEVMFLETKISSEDPTFIRDYAISELNCNIEIEIQEKSLGSTNKRLMAYCTAYDLAKKRMADDMDAVLKSLGNYDFSKELSIEVNGNAFIYEEDFPIEDYMDELKSMGEYEQGKRYSVCLANEKLVIY